MMGFIRDHVKFCSMYSFISDNIIHRLDPLPLMVSSNIPFKKDTTALYDYKVLRYKIFLF